MEPLLFVGTKGFEPLFTTPITDNGFEDHLG